MARYFLYFPAVWLALVALACGEEVATKVRTTTWDNNKRVKDCERRSKQFDKVTVHYVGMLAATKQPFDSSYVRNEPFEFQIGMEEVIVGWDKGMRGMCVGEKRTLYIPENEGYGADGAGEGDNKIPKNADLQFEVELMKIEAMKEDDIPPDVFTQVDKNGDRKIDRTEMFAFLKERAKHYGIDGDEHDDQHKEVVQSIFANEDVNKDDRISHSEFSGPKHDPTEKDEL